MNPTSCFFIRLPSVRVLYPYVTRGEVWRDCAKRFAESYCRFRPTLPHKLTVVCNTVGPESVDLALWKQARPDQFFIHDNIGWEVGAWLAAGKSAKEDMLVCFNSHGYVARAGWLDRFIEARAKHGPGLYGTISSFEANETLPNSGPHLNASGFALPPALLNNYPVAIRAKFDRYLFENSDGALWRFAVALGLPVKLLTWDGEFDWPDWRTPPNIFRRGDQSNCVTRWRHHDIYDQADGASRATLERTSDELSNPFFRRVKANGHQSLVAYCQGYFETKYQVGFNV